MTDHWANGRSRHDSTFMVRALFWLFALFSIAETPLGKGDLFGADGRLLETARLELRSGDLPPRHSTAGSKQRQASLVEYCRELVLGLAAEHGGTEPALARIAPDLPPAGDNVSFCQPISERQPGHLSPGFASRAPPAFA